MDFKVLDEGKIVKELVDVLVKNQVPIKALDNLLEKLKDTVAFHTIIQK
jgi:hypothetical protein